MANDRDENKGFVDTNEDELKSLAKAVASPAAGNVASAAAALLVKLLTGSSIAAGAVEAAVGKAFGEWFANTPDARLSAAAKAAEQAAADQATLQRFGLIVEPLVRTGMANAERVLETLKRNQGRIDASHQESFDVLAEAMWEALDGVARLELGQGKLLAKVDELLLQRNRASAIAWMRPAGPLHLKIFVSSPGDVAEERRIAFELIRELASRPAFKGELTTEIVAYDEPHAATPMDATITPQAAVNETAGRPSNCDLTLVFLWSRLGTPLASLARPDGSRYESGTVWELEDAQNAGKPVWLFRRTEEPKIGIRDPSFEKKRGDFEAVEQFFARFNNTDGSIARGYNAYPNSADLRRVLAQQLEGFAARKLREAQPELAFRPSTDARPQAKLHGVPPLPAQYVARSEFKQLRKELLSSKVAPSVLAGQPVAALQGMAGVGKTTLAIALARDSDVVRSFPDGVFWFTLGQTPESGIVLLNRFAAALSGEAPAFQAETDARTHVQALLEHCSCLLVLDDVWDVRHLEPFLVLGSRSRLLVTTRKSAVSGILAAHTSELAELPHGEALELLSRYAGLERSELPKEAEGIVKGCGELPLALAMVGALLRGRPLDRWQTMRARLDNADMGGLETALPGYPHKNVLSAIKVSVEDLSSDHRVRYMQLGAFPEDTAIPQVTLALHWNLRDADAQDTIDAFVDRALARYDLHGGLQLHDLQHDFVRASAGDLTPLHERLVRAYRAAGEGELFRAPNDGYAYDHLAAHLFYAEGADALRSLLFDLRWLTARLEATDANRLLTDFELLPDAQTAILASALRQASHVLSRETADCHGPGLLAGQILARLQHRSEPQLRQLCGATRTHIREQRMLEPQTASLQAPAALDRTLLGHSSSVTALAMLSDGRLASASDDATIKVWNARTGVCEATIEGHTGGVKALAVLSDGRLASGSGITIKLWNAETGACEATLEGHSHSLRAPLVALSDGRLASTSDDGAIKLWNAQTGVCDATLERRTRDSVTALTMLSDGRFASGSVTGMIELWNVQTGARETMLERRTRDSVTALTMLSDGRFASGSVTGMIELWNVQTGACEATFKGHRREVTALAALPDGRLASASWDCIKVWNPLTGACQATLEEHASGVAALAALSDGRLVSGSSDASIKLWNALSGAGEATLEGRTGGILALAVLADARLASGSSDGAIRLWSSQTRVCEATLKAHTRGVTSLAVLADARLASGSSDGTIRLWNPQTCTCEATLEAHAGGVTTLAALSDGQLASSGSSDKSIKLWNAKTGVCEATLKGHGESVSALAVLSDGRLVSGSSDGTIRLWNPQTRACEARLGGHTDAITALAVLADGGLASGSADKTIKLWDAQLGACRATSQGHSFVVHALVELSDGRLALGSSDQMLRLWRQQADAEQRETVAFVTDAPIGRIAYERQAALLVLGDGAGRLHFLKLPTASKPD